MVRPNDDVGGWVDITRVPVPLIEREAVQLRLDCIQLHAQCREFIVVVFVLAVLSGGLILAGGEPFARRGR